MRNQIQNENFVITAFDEYIKSNYFSGVVSPGEFYEFCRNTERAEINESLINRLPISIKTTAKELNLKFNECKPKSGTKDNRSNLLQKAFKIIDSNQLKIGSSLAKFFPNDGDNKKLLRYVDLLSVYKLHEKKITPSDIPNWPRNKGKEILEEFSNCDIDSFQDYLAKLKKPSGLLNLKTTKSTKKGVVYAKETKYSANRSGYIVVKLGLTEKKDPTRAITAEDIKLGHECRVFGTNDIQSAENKALSQMQSDPLCIPFNLPNRSPRSRNQEYYEIPLSHFNCFANYVKDAATYYMK
ncbi:MULTISPECIES: hypothetical protein [unclassified Pseudoalteromonas]|uniref:hypothetical protein n=1 Tax=unclassified Pseudoalteromonas TaxID=194690 RepID=UPI0016016A6C|nr:MULTISPECIES: hypothetical protein [unclassified Pseudoalteromonas]MBB1299079.1 hypothetical protein [Pseudoalteromonas sp. SR41-7]MBB1403627.1 hypothetical protein [Pseudoalteromonas sp. SG45-1]